MPVSATDGAGVVPNCPSTLGVVVCASEGPVLIVGVNWGVSTGGVAAVGVGAREKGAASGRVVAGGGGAKKEGVISIGGAGVEGAEGREKLGAGLGTARGVGVGAKLNAGGPASADVGRGAAISGAAGGIDRGELDRGADEVKPKKLLGAFAVGAGAVAG